MNNAESGEETQQGRHWFLFLLLMLLVVLAAELSRLLSLDVSNMSAIWPPLGIAIGATLVLGLRALPAYALALGGWMLWRDYSLSVGLLVVVEQTLQCLVAVWLLRRALSRPRLLDNLRDTLRFYLWGALLALLPFALLTSFGLKSLGMFSEFRLLDVWLVYWLSEALGVMLFAPLAEQLFWSVRRGLSLPRPSRSSLLFVCLLVALVTLNMSALAAGAYDYGKAVTYLYFPLLAWAAMSGRRWLSLLAVPLVACVVLGFVVAGSRALVAPAGFLLVEAVLVIFMMTLMTQLVQAVSHERQALSSRFRSQARRDLRTGLLNDRGLLEQIADRRRVEPDQRWLGVLELRNFDDAEDVLEIGFATRLEQFVGDSIAEQLGDDFPVARVGSGRLAFYWCGDSDAEAEQRMDALWRRLQGFTYAENGSLYVLGVAIGLCQVGPADSADACLSAAGQAARHAAALTDRPMYRCRLDDELITARHDKLARLEELKLALSENRFLLYCQEIRAVESLEWLPGYEVLIRMLDRQGNIVSPGAFMPVAEDYGLVGQIDRWVVERVFRWVDENPRSFARVAKLAINLSGATLADPGFPGWVAEQRRRYRVEPERIGFEVTESQQIGDWQAAFRLLAALREQGFSISLDDFGTGLATFDYLTSFPFDVLKIDGRFVRNIADSPVNQSIVSSITAVARTMGLTTVAEFVEDQKTLQMITALDVDHVQGYGIARPQPLADLEI